MRVLSVALVLFACGFTFYAVVLRKRPTIADEGARLVSREELFRHSFDSTRCLERILEQDRMIPILPDEVRVEAERLVKAFYDKGDR